WDPATGFLHDYRPTAAWQAKNPPAHQSPNIQVSECATNTRLKYPKVQLFAWFQVNHASDGNHGCPYGTCYAYAVSPAPADLEPSFTDGHVFFWHGTGGRPGTNPQSGAFGYEVSLSGKYVDGPPDTQSMQVGHDTNYPNFDKSKLKPWSQSQVDSFKDSDQSPKQPKCGRPCEPNKDPGSKPGAYGGYKPAPASAYKPPKGWKPGKGDTCFGKGGQPIPKADRTKPGEGSPNGNKKEGGKPATDQNSKKEGGKPATDNPATVPKGKKTGDGSSTDPRSKKDGSSTTKPKDPNQDCAKFCGCISECKEDKSCISQCDNDKKCSPKRCKESSPSTSSDSKQHKKPVRRKCTSD
ncbi:hypothetical protein PTTG_26804, partial [Puccinia triticina 1-1 BBBD Race 1]